MAPTTYCDTDQPDCGACKMPLPERHVQALDGIRFCCLPCLQAARPVKPGEALAYFDINAKTVSMVPPSGE